MEQPLHLLLPFALERLAVYRPALHQLLDERALQTAYDDRLLLTVARLSNGSIDVRHCWLLPTHSQEVLLQIFDSNLHGRVILAINNDCCRYTLPDECEGTLPEDFGCDAWMIDGHGRHCRSQQADGDE